MKYEILPNGIRFSLEDNDRDSLRDIMDRATHLDHGVLAELLEPFASNGVLYAVLPEQVPGALTDAPMLTDDMDFPDNGEATAIGRVWWFPNYQVESFAETLLETGSVFFPQASSA